MGLSLVVEQSTDEDEMNWPISTSDEPSRHEIDCDGDANKSPTTVTYCLTEGEKRTVGMML